MPGPLTPMLQPERCGNRATPRGQPSASSCLPLDDRPRRPGMSSRYSGSPPQPGPRGRKDHPRDRTRIHDRHARQPAHAQRSAVDRSPAWSRSSARASWSPCAPAAGLDRLTRCESRTFGLNPALSSRTVRIGWRPWKAVGVVRWRGSTAPRPSRDRRSPRQFCAVPHDASACDRPALGRGTPSRRAVM